MFQRGKKVLGNTMYTFSAHRGPSGTRLFRLLIRPACSQLTVIVTVTVVSQRPVGSVKRGINPLKGIIHIFFIFGQDSYFG